MACANPLRGWRSKLVNESGKRSIVFKEEHGIPHTQLDVPCGQCVFCRLEKSRQWAIRCVHEASLYDDNCFITLTYNPENLPENGSLDKSAYQLFMKRFRKKYVPKNPYEKGTDEYDSFHEKHQIRFFHCGEYGEKNNRPHYHAIIFNHDFADRKFYKMLNGNRLYTSESLSSLWPHGFATIGDVTFESAAYVARYIMKKVTGEHADDHYQGKEPEYVTMSRRPGIAKGWYDLFKDDIYPSDFVVIRGQKMRAPRFYDNQLELENPTELRRLKINRKTAMSKHADDNTIRRLRVKEKVKNSQAERLKRPMEVTNND